MLAVPPELALAQQNILSGRHSPIARGCDSQPPHPLLHPLLPDVGVNLGGGDGLMAEQRLDIHQLGPGVEQVRGVSMAQLVQADLLVDAGLLQHPPQIGAGRLRGHRLLARRAGGLTRPGGTSD